MIFALDSNIISYLLKNDKEIKAKIIKEAETNGFVIPPVVYYEVKRWLLEKQATSQMREFDTLCEKIPIGDMNKAVWDTATELYVSTRSKGTPVDDADLLIAAFCLVNGYVLVTNNTRHFTTFSDLRQVNWKK